MTRYTRLGKSTHQRVAGESTTWDELQTTPKKDRDSGKKGRIDKSQQFKSKDRRLDDRRMKGRTSQVYQEEVSANFTELGERNTGEAPEVGTAKNKNVKGHGQSKTVKIFGQFWVAADDAKRLQGLVKKLRKTGLSRKEIGQALQNEQRRAEKAAKRIRDKTCFGCRQFGHVLSDCPKSRSTENSDGSVVEKCEGEICFKCGSTEHTSRHCKNKTDKFDFAKCFICSKVGHISRQCPENTRGIYPGGGECNVCGQLTHLAKDCPEAFGKPSSSQTKGGGNYDEDSALPVMSKLSNPFASAEYEPEISIKPSVSPAKKRRVKF